MTDRLQPPGAGRLLGTDYVGRDALSRLANGAGHSLGRMALLSLIPVGLVGGSLGLLAGRVGGRADALLMWAVDTWRALPGMFLALLLVGLIFPPGRLLALVTVWLALTPRLARAARDEVSALKAQEGQALAGGFRVFMSLLTLHLGLAILLEAT